jgi:hypothetical protein
VAWKVEEPLLREFVARPQLTCLHITGSKTVRRHILRDTVRHWLLQVSRRQTQPSHKSHKIVSCRTNRPFFLRRQQGFLELRTDTSRRRTAVWLPLFFGDGKRIDLFPPLVRRLSRHALPNTLTFSLWQSALSI